MKEKAHEDNTMVAKTPLMQYYAKISKNILWIRPWQNDHQLSVNDLLTCIMGNLSGDWLQPVIDEVLAGNIEKTEIVRLPAPF
jgi:hypothetical protein